MHKVIGIECAQAQRANVATFALGFFVEVRSKYLRPAHIWKGRGGTLTRCPARDEPQLSPVLSWNRTF